jgi:hypothetical protein
VLVETPQSEARGGLTVHPRKASTFPPLNLPPKKKALAYGKARAFY